MKSAMGVFCIVFLMTMGSVAQSVEAGEALDVFNEYDAKVKTGLTFEEQQAYFTARKNNEVSENLKQYSAQMKKTVAEVTRIMLTVAQRMANCEKTTFVSQYVEKDKATLIFDLEDGCSEEGETADLLKQTVLMVQENGWKIDAIEVE